MKRTYTDPNGITYDRLEDMCQAWGITTGQYYQRKYAHKDWTLEQILTAVPKKGGKVTDHTGEEGINNDGKRMVITACPNAHDMTVLFPESGFVRTGVYYTDFKHGMVKEKLSLNKRGKARIGERRQQNNGSWCKIIEYNNSNDILVRFDNGHEARVDYSRFVSGDIGDGEIHRTKRVKNLVGHTYTNDIGESYQVIKDMGETVEVRFDNGVIKTVRRKAVYTVRSIPKRRKESCHIGDEIFSKNGDRYIITHVYPRDKEVCEKQYVDVAGPEGEEKHVKVSNIRARKSHASATKAKRQEQGREQREKALKAVIGEKGTASCGTPITIIGGTGLKDITVQTPNGVVFKHQFYYRFKQGTISLGYSKTIIGQHRKKYLGMKVRQLIGYMAEVISYTDGNNVRIRFEDGEEVTTDIYHFTHGLVAHPKVKAASNTSLNEYTLYYVFKKVGFSKKYIHDKSISELYGKELDLYNPKLHLAIEYDGWFHKNMKRKDKEKDRLCKVAGITIYRIREPHVPFLNDGIAKEWNLEDSHYFSPALRDTIQKIAEEIHSTYGISIKLPDLSDDKIKHQIINDFSKKASFKKHIGEKGINNEGYKMEIIDYRGSRDIDVGFENGYISKNRSMTDFRKGRIMCVVSHIGERFTTKMGYNITVIADKPGNRVDVQFEDGAVAENCRYCNVRAGRCPHPNRKDLKLQSYIGEQSKCKNGMMCTVIKAYRVRDGNGISKIYVDVKFEDGVIVEHTWIGHFRKGYVRKPGNISRALKKSAEARSKKTIAESRERYMSQDHMSKDGYRFKIVRYHDTKHMRICFDDGFEMNTSSDVVNKGRIRRYITRNVDRNIMDFDEWVKRDIKEKQLKAV